jgi:hypothetical protein
MLIKFALVLIAALAMYVVPAVAADRSPTLVLSKTGLGPLALGKDAKISEESLKKLFPSFTVTYEIGQGDSQDFHYFEVLDRQGELLFAIRSFIEDESSDNKKTALEVPIHLLQVYSTQITDSYGLRAGDHVKDIIAKRGKTLSFGAGHHDVYLGSGEIYYSIKTDRDQSPEDLTLKDAIKGNWKIRSISWPGAAWE